MKLSACILIVIFVIISYTTVSYCLDSEFKVGHVIHTEAEHGDVGGIWKKKILWKARWVQEWKTKTITLPFWKKIWAPVEISEWIPKPNSPPPTSNINLSGA